MATRILPFLCLSLCCAAFTWPQQIVNILAADTVRPDLSEAELTGLLSNHAALENYSRRPDCFRRVAAKIRMGCGELEIDEDERVRAAISMTLCELATAARHSVPLECESFTVDSEAPSTHIQGDCVGALSRSAQFWSSYSGYLREVPQLCFAFRRWNDMDTARDIYKNSTMENAALIRFVLAREQADITGKQRWDTQISKLEDVAIRLKTVSDVMDVVVNAATPKLRDELDIIAGAFKAGLAAVQVNIKVESSQIIGRLGSELQVISQHHARSLDDIFPLLQTSLTRNLNSALSLFQTQALQTFNLANSAEELWTNLTHQFDDMQQKVLLLSEEVSDNANALETSKKQAQVVLEAQTSAALSASDLADALSHLTTTTRDSLDDFNASAVLFKQSLSPRSGVSELMRLVEVVWHLDPSTVTSLHRLPILPVVSSVLGFLFYLVRSSLAAFMSFAVLLFSARKCLTLNAHLNGEPYSPPAQTVHRDLQRREIRKSRIPDRLCRR